MVDLPHSTTMLLADWDGPGWWIVVVPIVWALVIVAFAFVLRAFVFRGGRGPRALGWGGRYGGPPSADEVLRRRFAGGELSADEYRERRAVLDERPPRTTEGTPGE